MDPYLLIAKGVLTTEVLGVLYGAYDAVWAELQPEVGDDPIAVERAREKLARVILSLPRDSVVEPELLKVSALAIMRMKT